MPTPSTIRLLTYPRTVPGRRSSRYVRGRASAAGRRTRRPPEEELALGDEEQDAPEDLLGIVDDGQLVRYGHQSVRWAVVADQLDGPAPAGAPAASAYRHGLLAEVVDAGEVTGQDGVEHRSLGGVRPRRSSTDQIVGPELVCPERPLARDAACSAGRSAAGPNRYGPDIQTIQADSARCATTSQAHRPLQVELPGRLGRTQSIEVRFSNHLASRQHSRASRQLPVGRTALRLHVHEARVVPLERHDERVRRPVSVLGHDQVGLAGAG